jgi:3-deoxy-D-manno-octulosonate 8-phosphate phosphatase (KDO 8-P phosphatase)
MRQKAQDPLLREKINKVKLLVLDVDGVLTDGQIVYDSDGRESRSFDAQDGIGILLLRAAGIKTVMITIKPCKAVEYRARDLKVEEVYQGIKPKTGALGQILERHKLNRDEICYVGDDLVDIGVMRAVGFPVAVENATREVKQAASYVTERSGGRGAVREIAELILMTQGTWHKVLEMEFGMSFGSDNGTG